MSNSAPRAWRAAAGRGSGQIQVEVSLLYSLRATRLKEKADKGSCARKRVAAVRRARARDKQSKLAAAVEGLGEGLNKRLLRAGRQVLGTLWVGNLPRETKRALLEAASSKELKDFMKAKLLEQVRGVPGEGARVRSTLTADPRYACRRTSKCLWCKLSGKWASRHCLVPSRTGCPRGSSSTGGACATRSSCLERETMTPCTRWAGQPCWAGKARVPH